MEMMVTVTGVAVHGELPAGPPGADCELLGAVPVGAGTPAPSAILVETGACNSGCHTKK